MPLALSESTARSAKISSATPKLSPAPLGESRIAGEGLRAHLSNAISHIFSRSARGTLGLSVTSSREPLARHTTRHTTYDIRHTTRTHARHDTQEVSQRINQWRPAATGRGTFGEV
jgi:hypothetical protein